MKTIFITLISFLTLPLLGSSKVLINLELVNAPNERFTVYTTVDGYFFEGAALTLITNAEGKAQIQFESLKPGFCYFSFDHSSYRHFNLITLYVRPGNEYTVRYKKKFREKGIQVFGDDLVENKFLTERKRINLMKIISQADLAYFTKGQDTDGWYQKVLALREMELLEIGVLERTGAVSDEFAGLARADIQLYYASLIYELLSRTSLFQKTEDSELKAMVSIMIENEIHDAEQYDKFANSSMWYVKYLEQRMLYYTMSNQRELALHYKGYQNYTEAYWNLLFEFLNEKEFEVYMAYHIFKLYRTKIVDDDLIQLYRRYYTDYPFSVFTAKLKPLMEPEIKKMVRPGR